VFGTEVMHTGLDQLRPELPELVDTRVDVK